MNLKLILFFMALPFFYNKDISTTSRELMLDEETSRHVVQVLRMKVNEQLNLTDGKGNLYLATIIDDHKKKCFVKIDSSTFQQQDVRKVCIAISLLKNPGRFEWFLEKATEIGVHKIIPLICTRTEKHHFRHDRMMGILVSAMLQSQQVWLPEMPEVTSFEKLIQNNNVHGKYIAHCEDEMDKVQLSSINISEASIILIGPEGDFTSIEIESAKSKNFLPVALGNTRLRTETAGMVAATLLKNLNG